MALVFFENCRLAKMSAQLKGEKWEHCCLILLVHTKFEKTPLFSISEWRCKLDAPLEQDSLLLPHYCWFSFSPPHLACSLAQALKWGHIRTHCSFSVFWHWHLWQLCYLMAHSEEIPNTNCPDKYTSEGATSSYRVKQVHIIFYQTFLVLYLDLSGCSHLKWFTEQL